MLFRLLLFIFSGGLTLTLPGSLRPEKPSLAVDSSINSASKNSLRHPRSSREARCEDGPGHQRRCVFPFSMWTRTFTTCTTYDGDNRFIDTILVTLILAQPTSFYIILYVKKYILKNIFKNIYVFYVVSQKLLEVKRLYYCFKQNI